jgi:hypothetical protein
MIAVAAGVALLAVIAGSVDRFFEVAGESRATRLTRMLLLAAATVVVVESILGAIGLLDARAIVGALAVIAVAAATLARRRASAARAEREPPSLVDFALAAALVAAILLQLGAGLHRTSFLYDTLSYHLHVPATWMHERRLSIVPAVFGDPSSAYAPANLELWFLFLLAPARSDLLAGVGQLPCAALAATAIVAAIREAGGTRRAALGGALAFLLIPEVWGQIATAMSDLGLAAFLLASLPFALRLGHGTRPRADLIAAATGIGLAVGSKYAGFMLALPFVAVAGIAVARNRRAIGIVGIAPAVGVVLATGGFWYIRNLVLTGNPFYPVAVPLLPLPALYGGAEMRAWEYHVPVTELDTLAAMLIAAGVGFTSAALVACARLWRGVEAPLTLALLLAFWLVIPYQESRFLFPALGVAAIAIGRAADRPPVLVGRCGLVIALAGALLQAPSPERLLLVPIAAVAAIAAALAHRLPWRPSRVAAGTLAVAGALGLLLLLVADARRTPAPRYDVGDEDLAAAWAWFRANVHGERVAYTGTNLAVPLSGESLANRVAYVNVAGAPGARLHDFGPPGDGTAEPAPYRRGASPDVWLANLRATGTQVLFVAALYPIVRRTIGADRDGFPIERAWADARPARFHLRFASPAARVYTVDLP